MTATSPNCASDRHRPPTGPRIQGSARKHTADSQRSPTSQIRGLSQRALHAAEGCPEVGQAYSHPGDPGEEFLDHCRVQQVLAVTDGDDGPADLARVGLVRDDPIDDFCQLSQSMRQKSSLRG